MNQDIISKVQRFIETIDNKGVPFDKVFVYGSAARGTMHEWSDIDVAVVGPSFGTDFIEEMVELRLLALPIDPAISPFPLRPEELEDLFNTIGQAVAREGKEI